MADAILDTDHVYDEPGDWESDIEVPSDQDDDEEEIDQQPATRGAPMVRGPWISVLDTENFSLPQATDFHRLSGPVSPPAMDAPPIEYLEQQLAGAGGEDLFDLLVRETNLYADQCREQGQHTQFSRALGWYPVDRVEMRAFLGLVIAMGIVKKPTIESYWNRGEETWMTQTKPFGVVMSRNRFQNIMRFLHCNDNAATPPRGHPGHALHKIQPVLDLLNGSFSKCYRLKQHLSVDERMVGFKGRSHIVQYMPLKKSHRWGVKMWVLAESATGYTHQVRIYQGRKLGGPPPKEGLGYSTVMDLVGPHLDKGHHIVCDNFFCSPSLCHDLFDRGTFCTGVVAVRRRGMPSSFQDVKPKPPKGTVMVRRQGPLLACLFSDRKVVTLLTTKGCARMEATTNSKGVQKSLPNVVALYNRTMGGVDLGDQLIQVYDPQMRSLKLWRKVLTNLLTTATVNASIVYSAVHGKTTTRLRFTTSLVQALVGPQKLRKNPLRLLQVPSLHVHETIPGKGRKWCRFCKAGQRHQTGSAGKVRSWCPVCQVGFCRRHFWQYHRDNHLC